jgi:hypothetical protein
MTWYGTSCRTSTSSRHAGLRVHPVEDRDLGGREPVPDERGDLGGDEARLGVLVLDLDDVAGSPSPSSEKSRFGLRSVFCSMSEFAARGRCSSSGSSARAR